MRSSKKSAQNSQTAEKISAPAFAALCKGFLGKYFSFVPNDETKHKMFGGIIDGVVSETDALLFQISHSLTLRGFPVIGLKIKLRRKEWGEHDSRHIPCEVILDDGNRSAILGKIELL